MCEIYVKDRTGEYVEYRTLSPEEQKRIGMLAIERFSDKLLLNLGYKRTSAKQKQIV